MSVFEIGLMFFVGICGLLVGLLIDRAIIRSLNKNDSNMAILAFIFSRKSD